EYIGKQNSYTHSAIHYWTPDRMQHAKELPLPEVNPHSVRAEDMMRPDKPESGDGAPPIVNIQPNINTLFTPLNKMSSIKSLLDKGSLNEHFSSSRLVPLSADLSYPYSTV